MARTLPSQAIEPEGTTIAPATRATEPLKQTEERYTVLLQPEQEGDMEALLRALIVIARRLASEQQTMVKSTEAGELIV